MNVKIESIAESYGAQVQISSEVGVVKVDFDRLEAFVLGGISQRLGSSLNSVASQVARTYAFNPGSSDAPVELEMQGVQKLSKAGAKELAGLLLAAASEHSCKGVLIRVQAGTIRP